MKDDSQRAALDADFCGSAADVFAVGVEVEWVFRFDAEVVGGEVGDFADV
jgi:hypothetical protein